MVRPNTKTPLVYTRGILTSCMSNITSDMLRPVLGNYQGKYSYQYSDCVLVLIVKLNYI